ncbi:MAG TPA: sigma-70 family RNA polymerase sigma factor [Burkholderiales bacterium]|nr:sigma-70 family RNA polymerase sigma factor [Burkholderiales bacterium]
MTLDEFDEAEAAEAGDIDDARPLDAVYRRPKRERRGFAAEQRAERDTEHEAAIVDTPAPSTTISARGLSPLNVRVDPAFLVERIIAGDSFALDLTVEIIHRIGWRTLRTYPEEVRDGAILDVINQLFGGLLGPLGLVTSFDPTRSKVFLSWVRRACRNAAIDITRKRRVKTVPYDDVAQDDDGVEHETCPALRAQNLGNSDDGMPIIPGADHADPMRQMEAQEVFEAIGAAKLTERERELADLLVAGMDDREIGDALDIAPSRARALIAKVRAKVKVAIEEAQ